MATVASFESGLKPETRPGDAISRQIALVSQDGLWYIFLFMDSDKAAAAVTTSSKQDD